MSKGPQSHTSAAQAYTVWMILRVQVTSSNFPRWDRNPNTTTTLRPAHQRIFHDASRASHITLPVVPAKG